MNNNKKLKIAVGMSGGVDSTITAHLLKEEGHTVIGITMKLWDPALSFIAKRSGCFGPHEEEDIRKAREAADKLGIEHVVVPVRDEYKKNVLEYFTSAYKRGLTPNPCVMCNQKIKFGALWERAQEQGLNCDAFATGHYARIEKDSITGRYVIKCGLDQTKDQSYFLYRLNQKQLARTLMPLGHYKKQEIKALARRVGLSAYADQKESQDFLETDDYGVLFEKNEIKPGNIVDQKGKILGQHAGVIYYTIGQRKGLGLGNQGDPLFVLKIDAEKNELIVGPKEQTFSKALTVHDLNWVALDELRGPTQATAKIRLGHKAASCLIVPGSPVAVEFDEPQSAITPGQSIVFYHDDTVLGGGIIG